MLIRDGKHHLHPEVRILGPLGERIGKEAALEGSKMFMDFFNILTIREALGSRDRVMLVYDLDGLASRVAVLLTFTDGLLSFIERFYDPRPFNHCVSLHK